MKEENSRKLLWIIRLNTPSFLQNTTVLRPPHQPVENDDTDVFNFQLSIFNYKKELPSPKIFPFQLSIKITPSFLAFLYLCV